MNYESIKNEFIELKKEELYYIDKIARISSKKKLSELEKHDIYRNLKRYEARLNEMFRKLRLVAIPFFDKKIENGEITRMDPYKQIIIEFDLDKNFLSSVNFHSEEYKERVLDNLWINTETFKVELTMSDLLRGFEYVTINPNIIQNDQNLIETPIYIFCGYYDSSEECYGPAFGYPDGYIYGIYENISYKNNGQEEIPEKLIKDFEKDKTIIDRKKYVSSSEIRKIFEEELLNDKNNSINDSVIQTRNRIENLSYIRSPEYKEKVLLDKINNLYETVKGEQIKKEVLYNGDFLTVLGETYKLANDRIVKKEKIIKNGGKNSVIVIAITQNKEYIITLQNRIKDKVIAEFASGYIETDEDVIDAAKRELKEETGYISDDLFVVDEAYTSPGTDNSSTYIVIANNCIKTDEKKTCGNELVNYGLFTEIELKYLICSNIMNGAMNKLAYYNLMNNVDDCNVIYTESNKKIYKMLKKRTNPLCN